MNTNGTFFLFNINISDPSSNFNFSSHEQGALNHVNLPLVERLTIYLTFVVSTIGLIGNAGTIIVLNQRAMRKWRSSILLSALAAVDFLYLFIIFLSIIDHLTNQAIGLHRSLMLCISTVYITHICSFLSANFTLSFTLQRFVAVLFPLHANTIISTRSSTINILLLVLLGCSFYSFSFFVTNISHGQCREDETYPALFPLLIVDICLTFLLPFIFILLFNIAIVYKLKLRKKFTRKFEASIISPNSGRQSLLLTRECCHERKHPNYSGDSALPNDNISLDNGRTSINRKFSIPLTDTPRFQVDSSIHNDNTHIRLSTPTVSYDYAPSAGNAPQHRHTISQRTTKMLVICSTTFLIFNSPYCAVLFYSVITKHVLTRTLDILRHFYFMSFCVNFFLYSLCGNRFRHELFTLFKALCRRCCIRNIRQKLLNIEKFPNQSSLSRVTVRTGL